MIHIFFGLILLVDIKDSFVCILCILEQYVSMYNSILKRNINAINVKINHISLNSHLTYTSYILKKNGNKIIWV